MQFPVQAKKTAAKDVWRNVEGKEFRSSSHYHVGGNTKFCGAALLRFRKEDFEELTHHDVLSPGWPIDYQDLEPYYTKAEHLYHVHGECRVDHTEPEAR